jgi:hypothetical protein
LDERIENYLKEERARREYCARMIAACFDGAKDQLGELDAWVIFVQFAKAASPDPIVAARDRQFEDLLLVAYDASEHVVREEAVIETGRRCRKPSDITLRRLAKALCRRQAAASSTDQLRLAFGLDPLEKVKQAQDQFVELSQGSEVDQGNQCSQDFSAILSDGAIEIAPQPDVVHLADLSTETDYGGELTPDKERLVASESESERRSARVVLPRPSRSGLRRKGIVHRRRRDGAQ